MTIHNARDTVEMARFSSLARYLMFILFMRNSPGHLLIIGLLVNQKQLNGFQIHGNVSVNISAFMQKHAFFFYKLTLQFTVPRQFLPRSKNKNNETNSTASIVIAMLFNRRQVREPPVNPFREKETALRVVVVCD